jgi:hypothetical protein
VFALVLVARDDSLAPAGWWTPALSLSGTAPQDMQDAADVVISLRALEDQGNSARGHSPCEAVIRDDRARTTVPLHFGPDLCCYAWESLD